LANGSQTVLIDTDTYGYARAFSLIRPLYIDPTLRWNIELRILGHPKRDDVSRSDDAARPDLDKRLEMTIYSNPN